MAGKIGRDQRVAPEREQAKGSHSATPTPQQAGPPVLNDGPELLRSNHC